MLAKRAESRATASGRRNRRAAAYSAPSVASPSREFRAVRRIARPRIPRRPSYRQAAPPPNSRRIVLPPSCQPRRVASPPSCHTLRAASHCPAHCACVVLSCASRGAVLRRSHRNAARVASHRRVVASCTLCAHVSPVRVPRRSVAPRCVAPFRAVHAVPCRPRRRCAVPSLRRRRNIHRQLSA